jgi:hypothetical protein
MAYLLLILPAFSAVLLAAHFHRAGQLALGVASLALIALLAVPRRWAARAVQVALALGALEWLLTLAAFAAERVSAGQPYLRLTVILLAVAAFTAASALVFRHAGLRARYHIGGRL